MRFGIIGRRQCSAHGRNRPQTDPDAPRHEYAQCPGGRDRSDVCGDSSDPDLGLAAETAAIAYALVMFGCGRRRIHHQTQNKKNDGDSVHPMGRSLPPSRLARTRAERGERIRPRKSRLGSVRRGSAARDAANLQIAFSSSVSDPGVIDCREEVAARNGRTKRRSNRPFGAGSAETDPAADSQLFLPRSAIGNVVGQTEPFVNRSPVRRD